MSLNLSKDTLGIAFVIISASMFSVWHYFAIHLFSNEMKGHIDMFRAVVEFWISRKFNCSLIVLEIVDGIACFRPISEGNLLSQTIS